MSIRVDRWPTYFGDSRRFGLYSGVNAYNRLEKHHVAQIEAFFEALESEVDAKTVAP